jgi:hypothetical protein
MKNILKKICVFLFFYNPLLQAMQQEVHLKIESIWGMPIEKSCCCTECCLGCLNYFCGALSSCFKKGPRNENVIIKFTETIGVPFYEVKQIVGILNQIDQKTPTYINKLAVICQGPIDKFLDPVSKQDQEQLLKANIKLTPFFQSSGIYKAQFIMTLQAALDVKTIIVKDEGTQLHRNSIKRIVRIRSIDELYAIFLERHMLHHATEALEEYLHFTHIANFFDKPIGRSPQQPTKKITTIIESLSTQKNDSVIK